MLIATCNSIPKSVLHPVKSGTTSSGWYTTNSSALNIFAGQTWRVDFCFMMNPDDFTSSHFYLLSDYSTSSAWLTRNIIVNSSGNLAVSGMNGSGYGYLSAHSTLRVVDGLAHRCVVIRNGATISFTVDGVTQNVTNSFGTNTMAGDADRLAIGPYRDVSTRTIYTYPLQSFYLWDLYLNKTATTKGSYYMAFNPYASEGHEYNEPWAIVMIKREATASTL